MVSCKYKLYNENKKIYIIINLKSLKVGGWFLINKYID